MTPHSSAPDAATEPDPGRWRILAVLLTTMFMSLVGVSIVNVVLPSIQTGLHADDTDIQWVLSGYALTFGVVLVAAGRAGDIVGRAPIFLAGVVIFTLSSVGAGLAPDPLTLNIARFIQGLGSGLLNPQVVGMIQHHFRGRERGRAYGALGSVVGVSVAIGPLLGGVIIQLFGAETGWRWTFLVNVPVGVVVVVLALLWFPRPLLTRRTAAAPSGGVEPIVDATEPEVAARGRARRGGPRERDLDPIGALLLGLAVLALLLPFVQGKSTVWTWMLLPIGLLLVAGWLAWERRYRDRGRSPMVDLHLFRTGSFTFGTLIAGLYFLGVTSVWVLVALYLQNGLDMTALQTGLMGLPAALTSAVVSNWAGKRVMDYGRRIVIAGILSSLAGLGLSILVIQLNAHVGSGIWWLAAALVFIGIAQGAVISPNQTLTLAEVPLRYSGSAGGVLQTGQRIGTAVGLALVTAIFFAVLESSDWQAAFTTGFSVIAGVVLVTLVVALADERRRSRQ
ncbi:MFS transporter [Arthrobacter sp. JSM 101049]|uniref:MFS transporter n=1 Tax=Arthrobacter sp. JSM 101049 TaxID=929097 RepID=UPI003564BFFC